MILRTNIRNERFYGDDMDFYMLPGGKVKEQEKQYLNRWINIIYKE